MERRPAEVFPPGDFIKEELEARGWTQAEFAEIIGRSPTVVNEIIAGKRSITPETAQDIGAAFDTGAQFWLNLEVTYKLWHARAPEPAVAKRSKLFSIAPIREMIKRQWIIDSPNPEVLDPQVCKFFSIPDLDTEPVLMPYAARKTAIYGTTSPAQRAWLFRVRNLASSIQIIGTFSPETGSEIQSKLRSLAASERGIERVPEFLSKAGIRFVVVEPLPRTGIDGACFWLNGASPVLAISLRFDRIDHFWHTLMHEVCHLLNGDGKDHPALDIDLVGGNSSKPKADKPQSELDVDNHAVEALIPQAEMKDFVSRTRHQYTKTRIRDFAGQIGVHPGIVVGQLQHRSEVPYSQHREMLVKVRDTISMAALTDGWGNVPSDNAPSLTCR